MASGFGESTSRSPHSPSFSNNNSNGDAGNFECNICFDLAQDPIVTLCGHLFCWPCLYKWLHIHSHYRECPVCKAVVEEEKLVPLYGRGKTSTDPRSKSIPGVNIPNRPAGQRPETAPPPEPNHFHQHGFGFMGGLGGLGGFAPMATARFGNFTLSAAFGGLIPSLFNLQVHGFPDTAMYGAATGFPYGFNSFHGGHAHRYPHHTDNSLLKFTVKFAMHIHFPFESVGDNEVLITLDLTRSAQLLRGLLRCSFHSTPSKPMIQMQFTGPYVGVPQEAFGSKFIGHATLYRIPIYFLHGRRSVLIEGNEEDNALPYLSAINLHSKGKSLCSRLPFLRF
ncbi:hypothetical protein JRO89_XS07G0052100 [Xanthoceras sorbifolium]|uniref:E3 ubiquitin-protein ligase RMA n=1 Tax=Xanthoceras sorbifolium TaxID=99658 RepID=A0ABQ8HSH0_9ROSI|nr:hypothetical protein JRO89_XS07G0052100 [Xanthoceras sorbifolium]